ncbi:PAS domain-containing protein [Microvirga pudoricolor]|uniref:PAS domain-containing protein n=1 Tax=Microvirga pudoricolor TaxID=2778729 RepID=UPI00194F444C|nr:PAS domain-containing protein [Microvirga pudoricolor]MBM6592970.1 PAS domain-containing protein [Microvirga pudoricolor]
MPSGASVDFKETEIQFALLADGLPQLVWTADPEGRHDYFNRRWYEFTGLSPEQSLGREWTQAFHPEDREEAQRLFAEALAAGAPYENEYRIKGADGAYAWFLGRALPVRNGSGRVVRWIGTCTDISGQKRAEDALRRLDDQHRLALEAAGLGTWDYDVETGMVSWDERACTLFGMAPDGLRSVPFEKSFTSVHPEDQESLRAYIASVLSPETGDCYTAEYRITLPGGGIRWIRSSGRVQRAESGERRALRLSGVCSDVTERRATKEAHQLLTSELNHRVKNLFAIASGLVSMTARTARDPKEMAAALRGRLGALSRAHELVRPAPVAAGGSQGWLAGLVEAIVAPYRQEGEHRIVLEGADVRLGPNALTSLALVLHELTTNAAKYGSLSEQNGALAVTWALDGEQVRITWAETGGPPIPEQPSFEGFGSMLSGRTVSGQLGGSLERDWNPDGLVIRMEMPLERLSL